eukprot:3251084-Prymnesium_polylepis.1
MRAHFATKKCKGARLRLNIGQPATFRTPHGVDTPQSRSQEPQCSPFASCHGRPSTPSPVAQLR